MVSEETAKAGSEGLSGLGRNGEIETASNVSVQTMSGSAIAPTGVLTSRRYGDFRLEEPDEPPSAGLSLSDYVVTKTRAKTKKGQKKGRVAPESDIPDQDDDEQQATTVTSDLTPVVKCPVCGEFEGDEVAVAHHVNTHFE